LSECDGLRDHCDKISESLHTSQMKYSELDKVKIELSKKCEELQRILQLSESKQDEMEAQLRKVVAEEQLNMKRAVEAMQSAQTNDQKKFAELLENDAKSALLISQLSKELEKRCDELTSTKHQLDLKDKELLNMKEIIKESESNLVNKERNMAASYGKERSRLLAEYESSNKKIAALETDKRESLHELTNLKSEVESLKQLDSDSKYSLKQIEKQLAAALKANEVIKLERNEVLGELKALTVESSVKDAEKEKECSQLREQVKSLEYELKTCRKTSASNMNALQESVEILNKEVEEYKIKTEQLRSLQVKAETEVKELIAINDELEKTIAQV
jgi:chromosome segregation ATPase